MDNYIVVNKELKSKNKTKRKMPNYPLSKNTSSHKKLMKEKNNNRIKENEIYQCLSQCIKLTNKTMKESKTKIRSKNHFSERQNKIQHNDRLVENILKVKADLSPFNSISYKKYPNNKQNFVIKDKSANENLDKNKFSKIKLEKNKKKEELYINASLQNEKNIEINRINISEQKNNINKNEKNEEIIDISDNEDEDEILIINNDDDNESSSKVMNTIFPKLSSNPFLTLNIDKNHLVDSNNSKTNNRNNIKIYFSPNITRRKRCNRKAILYNQNLSKTRVIISLNSSTSQNSNETINNINNYNLDLKTKKIKDLNSNIYIEGETENEKNNNINQNKANEENNANLIIEDLINLAKNGNFSEIFEKLREKKNNSINFNYKDIETGNSLLHFACQGNNIKLIKYLIKSNCDINIKNNENQTPLHLASMKGDLEISKCLAENGALLNLYDFKNYTPIHYACYNNFTELINYFFEKYIEIDTDEKSSYNFSKNKDISTLFHNYFRKKNDTNLLHNSNLNYDSLNQKEDSCNTERKMCNNYLDKSGFKKCKINSKSKNKEIKTKTLEKNENRNKVINLKNKKDKSKNKDLNSNYSLNISNEVINESSYYLKNSSKKSKSKYKQKKYKKDTYKTASLKTKNFSNNILFISLPIEFKKLNDSQIKNKENNNDNVVNETAYIEESHINLKLNKIKEEKKLKITKKNYLTLYLKKRMIIIQVLIIVKI